MTAGIKNLLRDSLPGDWCYPATGAEMEEMIMNSTWYVPRTCPPTISPKRRKTKRTNHPPTHPPTHLSSVYVNLDRSYNTPSNPYRLDQEIIIDRHVVIQGNSLGMPFIDCFETVRCFRVVPGGYLEMRYVNINQGTGEYREPIPILEVRPFSLLSHFFSSLPPTHL